jgi:SNF2 family DNA or RNA helicase
MKDVEAGNEVSTGGWLASEVGMGKSAIVLALVASDLVHPIHPLQLKTTVILTSVSLMGQWEDEVQKHAPGLKVRRFHPPSRSKVPLNLREPECHWEGELPTVDVLISTATFAWPTNVTKDYMFHRVVMDEAHLFASPRAANINHANQIKARRKWCVTATPCSNSIYDLSLQVCFLGQSHLGSALMRAQKSMCAGGSKPSIQVCNHEVAQQFSKYMIRHEKSQLLGDGSEALSLPPTVTKVVTLQMTPAERFIFQTKLHQSVGARLRQYQTSGIGIFPLEQQVLQPLCSNSLFSNWRESSKIGALLQDIASLQKEDFNLRAVVFTQYTHTHGEVVKALRAFFGIPVVYELTGSTSATNRDFAIRAFQGPRTFPAVIVVTLRAGSVGMTLTNASRLYLMEPSIDSAAELQAMGRIHRLGQDRPVQVTKFVQADTVEANLLELHKEIQAGRIAPIQNNHVPGTAVTILARNLLL